MRITEGVGGRVREHRRKAKLSAQELGAKVGLKANSLLKVERGERGIAYAKLKLIALTLRVHTAELLGLESAGDES